MFGVLFFSTHGVQAILKLEMTGNGLLHSHSLSFPCSQFPLPYPVPKHTGRWQFDDLTLSVHQKSGFCLKGWTDRAVFGAETYYARFRDSLLPRNCIPVPIRITVYMYSCIWQRYHNSDVQSGAVERWNLTPKSALLPRRLRRRNVPLSDPWDESRPTGLYILCWRELSRRRLLPVVSPAAGHLTTPTVAGLPGLC